MRTVLCLLNAALLALALTGCEGSLVPLGEGDDDVPGGPDGGNATTARAKFDSDVAAVAGQRCASCHAGVGAGPGNAPRFMGTGPATEYYTALTTAAPPMLNLTNVIASPFIAKGIHFGGAGPAFDPATEKPKIQAWIEAEAKERAGK
jgi:mono/diheme cytochrome c family protein